MQVNYLCYDAALHNMNISKFSIGKPLSDNLNGDLLYACMTNDSRNDARQIMECCDLCDTNSFRSTYLHFAVVHNSVDVVRLLLAQKNVRINAKNKNDETPVHLVKSVEILQELIAAGCDLNAISKNGTNSIASLLRTPDVPFDVKCKMLTMLLEHGADPGVINGVFYTILSLLHYKSISDEQFDELFSLFLEHGADPNEKIMDVIRAWSTQGSGSNVPIMKHVMYLKSNLVFQLIWYGADINFCTYNFSYLSKSVESKDNQLFKYLWKNCNKSDIFKKDTKFLQKFLFNCEFGKEDFLEALYMILDSKFATDLIRSAYTINNLSVYYLLIRMFEEFGIERDERVKVIYTFLTRCNHVSYYDLIYVYETYGFNEELEAFMVVTVDISDYKPHDDLTFLCYPDFELNPGSQVMSLMECSRNAFRQRFKHVEGEAYFKYYNEVQKMNIPQWFKDVICMKIPIDARIDNYLPWMPPHWKEYVFN